MLLWQVHWNNPERRDDYVDSSGLRVHYTTSLRPNDVGTLTIGQEALFIPPGQQQVIVYSHTSQAISLKRQQAYS